MMRKLWIVLRKEVIDNLRDRRTLLTVLVFGPLFGPIFYVAIMNVSVNQQIANLNQPLKLPVQGAQYAPNLVDFLKQHNTEIVPAPANPQQAVKAGTADVVLIIPREYAAAFRAGKPAVLQLVMDQSKQSAQKSVGRARELLRAYDQEISALRLLVRGVDPRAVTPLAIENLDVSTPQARAGMLLAFIPYFFLFAAIIGAFYLAIDATAGERERGSLEPLLTTAVSRSTLIGGKLAAVTLFSAVSLGLDVVALSWSQGLIPAAKLNIVVNFGWHTALAVFLVMLPFCLLMAALLTVVASFTRSYKEAQTWLSFILILPMIPVFALFLFPAEPRLWMMLVPALSQDVLATALMKGAALGGGFVSVSVVSTLVIGLLLAWFATWLYRREKLLG
ncbi:MAG: ABC transporter permease [Gammaproteobacteria bacterium]|nr:ABC transporter permease [Gammaproteobacteria bacterium]MBU6509288.1 ABC transporter permease [Gammaproteobacteria bacterium]MDE1983511.1 ABC transporter permease [Gammaproteobacteria bacterium]MDE2107926.1 ABC transporter permease [Gammaproteobacteria bacterium]MDE2460253.1 ABC transporter permease [Gammaproteobacteria bacterium]